MCLAKSLSGQLCTAWRVRLTQPEKGYGAHQCIDFTSLKIKNQPEKATFEELRTEAVQANASSEWSADNIYYISVSKLLAGEIL